MLRGSARGLFAAIPRCSCSDASKGPALREQGNEYRFRSKTRNKLPISLGHGGSEQSHRPSEKNPRSCRCRSRPRRDDPHPVRAEAGTGFQWGTDWLPSDLRVRSNHRQSSDAAAKRCRCLLGDGRDRRGYRPVSAHSGEATEMQKGLRSAASLVRDPSSARLQGFEPRTF